MKTWIAILLFLGAILALGFVVLLEREPSASEGDPSWAKSPRRAKTVMTQDRPEGAWSSTQKRRQEKDRQELLLQQEQHILKLEGEVEALKSMLEAQSPQGAPELFAASISHADSLFEAEKWLEAGDAYLKLVESVPGHPLAEELLEKALDAYEWEHSAKQIVVLEEIFRRFPEKRTPRLLFESAILHGVHGEVETAIEIGKETLEQIAADDFRIYALRRMAGFFRKIGDAHQEELYLRDAHSLAVALNKPHAVKEIERSLALLSRRN